jgi:histone arginine demethylase JMJD6
MPATELLDPYSFVETAPATAPRSTPPAKFPASDSPEHAIERRGHLHYRDFLYEYQHKRRPVIITDATSGWAAREWTPTSLQRKLGAREITFRDAKKTWQFDELAEAIIHSTPANPAPYARNINVARDLPELMPDISPRLVYATPDWKSTRLLPKDWLFPNALEELFFGGAGARFPSLHVDYYGMDGFISQLYGDKEFLVFAPSDGPYLHAQANNPLVSAIDNFDEPDYDRFPLLKHATPIRFTLRAGETFYQPSGWWHTTSMHEVSITLITQTWNADNWPILIDEYKRSALKGGKLPLKSRLSAAYLRAVGCVLSARDRIVQR